MRLIGPRDGSGMLRIIVIIVALLLGAGGVMTWNTLRAADDRGDERAAADAAGEQENTTGTETLSLGEFLVNLQSSDGTLRYLQAQISIVVTAPDEAGASGHDAGDDDEEEAELPPASHRYARDVAIEVLSTQSFEHLRDHADRSKLKAMLQQKLDAALETHDVQDVLFTAFVMQ